MTGDDGTYECCARCLTPAPDPSDPSDDSYLYWEVLGGQLICPGCITGEELQAIDEADMATIDDIRALAGHCARCLKDVPYATDDPGEPLPSGWVVLDADIDALLVVCPDCVKPDDELVD
jgi:hypothetical protein